MKPPWLEAPHIEIGMGWRMGYGANLIDEFALWFLALCQQDREQYALLNPEPDGWNEFYQNIIDCPSE